MNAIYKNVLFLKQRRVEKNPKSTIFFFAYFCHYILVLLNQERETSTKKYKK